MNQGSKPQIALSSHFQDPGSAPNGDTSWYALPLAVPPSRHAALSAYPQYTIPRIMGG